MSRKPKIRRLRRVAAAVRGLVGFDVGPHRCPSCLSAFVCPMDWTESGDGHWVMQLRCAQCDTWREVRLTNEETRDFELLLDRQTAVIQREVDRIDRESMRVALDLFVAALEHDAIDANDFTS